MADEDSCIVLGLNVLSRMSGIAEVFPQQFGHLFTPLNQMARFTEPFHAPSNQMARALEAIRDGAAQLPPSGFMHAQPWDGEQQDGAVQHDCSPVRGLLHRQHGTIMSTGRRMERSPSADEAPVDLSPHLTARSPVEGEGCSRDMSQAPALLARNLFGVGHASIELGNSPPELSATDLLFPCRGHGSPAAADPLQNFASAAATAIPTAAELLLNWNLPPQFNNEHAMVAASSLAHSCFTLAQQRGPAVVNAIAAGLGYSQTEALERLGVQGEEWLLADNLPEVAGTFADTPLQYDDEADCDDVSEAVGEEQEAPEMAMSQPESEDEYQDEVQSVSRPTSASGTADSARPSTSGHGSVQKRRTKSLSRSRSPSPTSRYATCKVVTCIGHDRCYQHQCHVHYLRMFLHTGCHML